MTSESVPAQKTFLDRLHDDIAAIVAKLQGIPAGIYYLLVLTVFSIFWAALRTAPETSWSIVMLLPLFVLIRLEPKRGIGRHLG